MLARVTHKLRRRVETHRLGISSAAQNTSGWWHLSQEDAYALPGHAKARGVLARPFEGRLFFAGEATQPSDFSTAHGAHDSGVHAAEEAIAVLTSSMTGI